MPECHSCQLTNTWSPLTGVLLTLSVHFLSVSGTQHFSFLFIANCIYRIFSNLPPFIPSHFSSSFPCLFYSLLYSLLPFPCFFSVFYSTIVSISLVSYHEKTNSNSKNGSTVSWEKTWENKLKSSKT